MNQIAAICAKYPPEVVGAVMARFPHGVTRSALVKPVLRWAPTKAAQHVTDRRAQVQALVKSGLTAPQIARYFGVKSDVVTRDLIALGIKAKRSSNGYRPCPKAAARRREVARFMSMGCSAREIAALIGATHATVKNDRWLVSRGAA